MAYNSAMPGHKKPNPIRRNKPQQPDLRLVVGEVPDVPEWMSPKVAEWWTAYWASDLAAATYAPTNQPALRRLFHMCDEEATMAALCSEDPMLVGSQGQPVGSIMSLRPYPAPRDTSGKALQRGRLRSAVGTKSHQVHRYRSLSVGSEPIEEGAGGCV